MSTSTDPAARGFPADPMVLAQEWLPPGANPCLMTLTTLDHGAPDARTVLLSELSPGGFFFHTDAYSRKCAQIAADPRVALVILLADQARQLVVQGVAERADSAEIAQAYRDRGPYLQQLAWMNTPEFAALDEASRVRAWAEFGAAHVNGFPQPDGWTGYVVRPRRMTFWWGAADTASRRVEYALGVDGWEAGFLAG